MVPSPTPTERHRTYHYVLVVCSIPRAFCNRLTFWPCVPVGLPPSYAHFRTTESRVGEAERVTKELARLTRSFQPRLIIVEQTAGLAAYCPSAYRLYLGMWVGLGYHTAPHLVDAHSDCGGLHVRRR